MNEPELTVLLRYFDAARANIVTRLAARDRCILLYLAAVAVIMTAGIAGSSPRPEVMLVIPIISLAVAIFVSQHNFLMDILYEYVAKRIHLPLKRLGLEAIPWEVSPEYKRSRSYSTGLRLIGEAVVILFPASFAIYNYRTATPPVDNRLLFCVAITASILATLIILGSFLLAIRHHYKLKKIA